MYPANVNANRINALCSDFMVVHSTCSSVLPASSKEDIHEILVSPIVVLHSCFWLRT